MAKTDDNICNLAKISGMKIKWENIIYVLQFLYVSFFYLYKYVTLCHYRYNVLFCVSLAKQRFNHLFCPTTTVYTILVNLYIDLDGPDLLFAISIIWWYYSVPTGLCQQGSHVEYTFETVKE